MKENNSFAYDSMKLYILFSFRFFFSFINLFLLNKKKIVQLDKITEKMEDSVGQSC